MSNLQSILYEIRPCDLGRPYIFVSYSNLDSELVWKDVREFQRRGFNVWLDEKNLDKTKTSWREDAIAAIEDMECELVVFYVSANSLRSDACYQELSKTVEERTKAMHFGPVKFIAVDAEPVGDITAFAQQVFRSIRRSGLDKDERSLQALALDGFMRDFFNSNNEKVRIHPKDEPNRKIDYYDDITASFPEIARIYEPEAEEVIPEPEPEEEEATFDPKPEEEGIIPESEKKTSEDKKYFMPEQNEEAVSAKLGEDPIPKETEEQPELTAEEVKEQPELITEETEEQSEPAAVKAEEEPEAAVKAEEKPEPTAEETEEQPEPIPEERNEPAPETDASEEQEGRFTKAEGEDSRSWPRKIFGKKEVRSTAIKRGKLEIPEGYTGFLSKLGHALYWGNSDIVDLILPDSMTELNIGEFRNCPRLKTVRMPKYLVKIPYELFQDCSSLKEIVIPGNVTAIDSWAFKKCSSLQKAVLPEGLEELGSSVFEGCTSLKEIHLPPQLKKMDMSCFQRCGSLKKVRIPGSLKRIPLSSFEECVSLRTVIIEEGVERIDTAFGKCGTGRMHVWIPDSVTTISSLAFDKSAPTIHCHKGSFAEDYAKRRSYPCVLY